MSNQDTTDKEIRMKELELANNAMLYRHELLRKWADKRRDVDEECHYPEEIDTADIWKMYKRFGVARRVNDIFPMECFRSLPRIYEDPDESVTTGFEQSLTDMSNQLSPDSWLASMETTGNVLFDYMRRADIVSGIGRYGIVLFGLNDNLPLDQPARPRANQKLNYIRCLPESMAPIATVERNPSSKRLGLPVYYNVTIQTTEHSSLQLRVHYTRVLHIVDSPLWSDAESNPRIEPVYNHLLDLYKLYGSSAEGYWQGAFPGLSIETHPQLGGEVVIDHDELRNQLENRRGGLQRDIALLGMTARSLMPQVVDPTAHIDRLIEAICILINVPKRRFMGTEQGVLAGDQDSEGMDATVMSRNMMYLAPRLIGPFINKLIWLRCLEEPEQFYIDWTKPDNTSDIEVADASLKRTQALAAYVAGDVDTLVQPLPFLTLVMKFDPTDAEEALADTIVNGELVDGDGDEEFDENGLPVERNSGDGGPPNIDDNERGNEGNGGAA